MKRLMTIILCIVAVVAMVGMYYVLFAPEMTVDPMYGTKVPGESIFDELAAAKEKYDAVKDKDYDGQIDEYERLKGEIAYLEAEISALNKTFANLDSEKVQKEQDEKRKLQAEINERVKELNAEITVLEKQIEELKETRPPVPTPEETFLVSTGDVVYKLLLDGLEGTTSDVVTFVGTNAMEGMYTVKFVGYLDSLAEVLDNITTNMQNYDISIGHCSLRQIYACYNNMRPWDKTTLLSWFDKKYVTGGGNVGDMEGGYIIDGVNINGMLGADTLESLTIAKDKDIEEIRAFYQTKLDAVEEDQVNAILAAYKGTDPDKVMALLTALNAHYETLKNDIREECAVKEAEILKTYNDRVAALDTPATGYGVDIGNPDLLVYTLDITISVYTNN
jgi:hypothetical protein